MKLSFSFPKIVFRCHSIYDSTRKARKAFRILKFVNECYEIGQLLSTWNDEVRKTKIEVFKIDDFLLSRESMMNVYYIN